MTKRIAFLCVLASALAAFLAPAGASAAQLESEPEVLAEVGTQLTAKSSNFRMAWEGGGTFLCENLELNGELTVNNGETVSVGEAEKESVATGCSLSGVYPIILTPRFENISLSEGGNSLTFSYVEVLGGVLRCESRGTVELSYVPFDSVFHIEGDVSGFGGWCPEHTFVNADFELTDGAGNPIALS
jgi:hypothetical protein